jgi:hypothetical protein
MAQIPIKRKSVLVILKLKFRIYLGFVIWNLEFRPVFGSGYAGLGFLTEFAALLPICKKTYNNILPFVSICLHFTY